MSQRHYSIHVISHIHWPREGFQTQEQGHVRLVGLLDRMLGILAQEESFNSFLLDGQTILAHDYLSVRPEKAAELVSYVNSGRIWMGPWYIATDPFLVSPEAIIRNLVLGQRLSQPTTRMPVSYQVHSNGEIGQLPQILSGFNIHSVVVQNGPGDAAQESWWNAPDGSHVLLICLRDGLDTASHFPDDSDELKAMLTEARDSLRDISATDVYLLMNSLKADTVDGNIGQMLMEINRRFRTTTVAHSSLPEYVEEVLQSADGLPTISGEFRNPRRTPIYSGTLSSRMWIKQMNHEAQTLLEHWAEPFSAWSSLLYQHYEVSGTPVLSSQNNIIEYAWRILFENQSAETIRGSSIDPVYKDVQARYHRIDQIAEELIGNNLQYIADQIATTAFGFDDAVPVVVFNGTGAAITGTIEVDLHLTNGWDTIELYTDQGKVIDFEIINVRKRSRVSDSITIRFVAEGIPAYGYRTYAARRSMGENNKLPPVDDENTIENEFLSVTLDPFDGTLSIFDKRTGRSFDGLNRFVDNGDRGDVYNTHPPERDTLISIATNTRLQIARLATPVTQSMEVLEIFRVPQTLNEDRTGRQPLAAQFIPVPISTLIQVAAGIPRVDISVIVTNGARDHRLRAHFPTGIMTDQAYFDGHFEIVNRSITLPDPRSTRDWEEQPCPDFPQRAFTTVLGGESGLTLASRGLPEVGLLQSGDDGVEIALTLLRSVGWINRNDLPNRATQMGEPVEAPDAQCSGEHTFAYSIIPHDSDPIPAWYQAWAFQCPLKTMVTTIHDGTLPTTASLVNVDNPAFVLSSVKEANDGRGIIVRGYSISREPEIVGLFSSMGFTTAEVVRIDETPTGSIYKFSDEGQIRFDVQPAQIVTLRLTV
jgi:alpha-mannosidase